MENGVSRTVDSVKLFVGQLPKQMSEQQLVEVFSEAGTVHEINIIKDKLTKQSRGTCSAQESRFVSLVSFYHVLL